MTEKPNIDERMIFGVSPSVDKSGPTLLIGIPRACWQYMSDGKTSTLDLNPIGMNIRLIVFGCEDHTAGMKMLEQAFGESGQSIMDLRREDLSIKVKP